MPRSTYYQSFHKVKSSSEIENEAILERIKIIHAESKGRYGAPKIHHFLEKEGFTVSLKRVQRIMKAEGIRSTITKKYRPASSNSQIEERDNLLEQDFETTTINEKWVADIPIGRNRYLCFE
ncbi:IS3 family transposase [Sporosarcina thermotolerans]|uniref:IS3 family transposase n=1 Tax=Sporosarcina thermotolerans TaxID=633404 RepID=A0AAW9AH62_9BACL|nr:IS3 family transposase [Sporosarcina thermotolerans]MDW0118533.1 IS3 family transposase [Sporosarcina thermotolerans]WHT49521.1 IS3 family transposase [Sporosarcina thermotolerans]